jgi:hypothetical protein
VLHIHLKGMNEVRTALVRMVETLTDFEPGAWIMIQVHYSVT